jgi:hypothetical protein
MNADVPSPPPTRPAWWRRPTTLVLVVFVLTIAVPLGFRPVYWLNLLIRSASEAWLLVFEKTWVGIVIVAAAWALGIWQTHREKWKEHWRIELQKVLTSVKIPIALFACIFLIHLFGVTPARINSELTKEKENAQLKRDPSPLPVNVAVTTTDEQARKDLAATRQELSEARAEIASLRASHSKSRRLTEADRTAVVGCLSASNIKGTIKLRPAITDAEAIEYSDALEKLFLAAGFQVTNFAGTFDGDAVMTWGFTGERILLNDTKHPPPHAAVVQKCFIDIGRTMPGETHAGVETNTLVIAIGGRP